MKEHNLIKNAKSIAEHGAILTRNAQDCTCANCGKAHAQGVNLKGSTVGLFVVAYTREGTAYACSEACKNAIQGSTKPLWELELAKQRNAR